MFPSSGEGWGSPPIEMLAQGCPVIATDWGGMSEYLHKSIAYPIRVEKLEKIKQVQHVGDIGNYPIDFFGRDVGHWAIPSFTHLCELMKLVYEDYDEALVRGRRGHEKVKAELTYDRIARQYLDSIEDLLKELGR
jgi:glycosyltransferase involved in cell wall biosynthesis